jgi:polysaccharide pyruvyl transferase WcaK-like protein
VTELARSLLAVYPGTLLLVPHTYAPPGDPESDNEACHRLKQSLPAELQARVRVVTGDYDAHQLKGIVARCGFFVGSRMHSCIAALSQGVPCVGVAYSMKFRGVFESVGLGDWVVDGRSADNAQAIKAILGFWEQRAGRAQRLGEQAAASRATLGQVFAGIINPAAGAKADRSRLPA